MSLPARRIASPHVAASGALVAALLVTLWSVDRGRTLQAETPWIKLGAAPLVGRDELDSWDWRWGWSLVGCVALAAAVAFGSTTNCWRSFRIRWLIAISATAATVFAVLLALVDSDGLRYGVDHETEYLANLPRTPPAGEFVDTFLDRLPYYTTHVRGHPPGYTLMLKLLAWIGLDGSWPVIAMSIIGVGVTVAAVLVCVYELVGHDWTQRVAAVLVVAPSAVWMVSSADSVFTACGAVAVACLVRSGRAGTPTLGRVGLGVAAGLLLGQLLYMTYLGATFLAVPAAAALWLLGRSWRRHWPTIVAAAAALAAVVAAYLLAGFWWTDGVDATRDQYHAGTAKFRPWSYFWFGNIGAALMAVGPLTVAGFGALRRKVLWLLPAGALVGIAASHLSTYTKAEVERIWLPYFPFLAVAAAACLLPRRRVLAVTALGAQAAYTIALGASLVQKW